MCVMQNKACNLKTQNRWLFCKTRAAQHAEAESQTHDSNWTFIATSHTARNSTYSLSLKNSFNVLLKFRECLTNSRLRTSSAWSMQHDHSVLILCCITTDRHTTNHIFPSNELWYVGSAHLCHTSKQLPEQHFSPIYMYVCHSST